MCRNIRVLANFEPPSSVEEMEAAALQYVRKVSGLQKPGAVDQRAFDKAVKEVAATTRKLLATLTPHGEPRTRDGEREKARVKWQKREAQMAAKFAALSR